MHSVQSRKATTPLLLSTQFPERRDRDRSREPVRAAPGGAHDDDGPPRDSGRPGRRYLIKGGSIMSMDYGSGRRRRLRARRRADRRQEDSLDRPEPPRRRRRRDRRARQDRDAGLHRHAPPPGLDGDPKLHSRQHPDRRRHGHAERRNRTISETFWWDSPGTTGRRTSTSANCSAASRSSTTA